ncbi:MAG: succinate dehydrogenase assembly factor 2 [Hydrogenophilus sp.]|nr:succinate dehydrogenase assembly factor 2 [Hydrogenophilus sp.]
MGVAHGQIRWRCRRAMLELDLALQPFAEEKLEGLSEEELESLASLLRLEDHDLWPLVAGMHKAPRDDWQVLIASIRQAFAARREPVRDEEWQPTIERKA